MKRHFNNFSHFNCRNNNKNNKNLNNIEYIDKDSINNTSKSPGRFCNHFIRNMLAHFICLKNNLKFNYSYKNEMNKLGINLYSGENTYRNTILLKDDNILDTLNSKNNNFNIICKDFYQTPEFSKILREHFLMNKNKNEILKNNKYNNRYEKNNDLFVHVRLGDIKNFNPGFDYYNNIIKNINFEKGYISSDSIDDPICKKLIYQYNLQPFIADEVDTIMFSTTCKHIILSNGTFSWTIGLLSFYSNIYYPINNLEKKWHGDIFVFDDWNGINI
jgi:hypothetical protein